MASTEEMMAHVSDEGALTLGLKRAAEMCAVFMIGDGLLGLTQTGRHIGLWRSDYAVIDRLVSPFEGRPGARRLYSLLQMGAGVALAASLRPRTPTKP